MEEVLEIKVKGELILCMDGIAKIGLIGEEISRNRKLLSEMIEECGLVLMNNKEICKGTIINLHLSTPYHMTNLFFKNIILFLIPSFPPPNS